MKMHLLQSIRFDLISSFTFEFWVHLKIFSSDLILLFKLLWKKFCIALQNCKVAKKEKHFSEWFYGTECEVTFYFYFYFSPSLLSWIYDPRDIQLKQNSTARWNQRVSKIRSIWHPATFAIFKSNLLTRKRRLPPLKSPLAECVGVICTVQNANWFLTEKNHKTKQKPLNYFPSTFNDFWLKCNLQRTFFSV